MRGLNILWLALSLATAMPLLAQQPPEQAPEELVLDGRVVGRRVPVERGDICLICNQPVGANDAVYLIQGQRVPLHYAAHHEALGPQLAALLVQLKPRGAFLGAVEQHTRLSWKWFAAGLYVLGALVFAGLAAHRALHAGHNPVAWFAVGLAFSAVGYLWLLTRPRRAVFAPAGVPGGWRKIAATRAPEACPACGMLNHPSATQCLGCGRRLEPKTVSEVARAGLAG